jgi:hypothetical protein
MAFITCGRLNERVATPSSTLSRTDWLTGLPQFYV